MTKEETLEHMSFWSKKLEDHKEVVSKVVFSCVYSVHQHNETGNLIYAKRPSNCNYWKEIARNELPQEVIKALVEHKLGLSP